MTPSARRCGQRLRTLAALLALAGAGLAAQAQAAPTLSIQDLGKGTAVLDGPWQFHLGDNPAFASPEIDDASGRNGWASISAATPWGAQGYRSYSGYAWYRKRLQVTVAPGASPDFALLIPHISDVYQIYWNGRLAATHGKFPPGPSYPYDEGPQTFGLGPIRDGVLAVRVWKAPLVSFDTGLNGGFSAAPLLGSSAAIAATRAVSDYRWLRSNQYFFAINSLYGLVAIMALLLWSRDRSRRLLLWMAIFSAVPLVQMVLTSLRLPWSYSFALGCLQPVLGMHDVSLWFLLLWLLNLHDFPRLRRIAYVLVFINLVTCSLDGALTMLDWSNPHITGWAQLTDAVLTVLFTLTEFFPLVLVVLGLRRRLDAARWLVAGFAFLSLGLYEFSIIMAQGSRYTHWTVSDKIYAPVLALGGAQLNVIDLARTGLFLAILYAVFRYMREDLQQRNIIVQELKSAQELQEVLIPDKLPSLPGFAITSGYLPAQEVGGDFFQILLLDGEARGSALIVLGDVSGKGLRAAMTVSLIVGSLRTLAETCSHPSDILAGLNRRLCGRLRGGFATCIAIRLEPDGACTLANAGHPFPLLNGRELPTPGALPLGFAPDTTYEEVDVSLRRGDHFVLYTDGLLEARNPAGELFGFERIQDLAATRPDAAAAIDAAVRFGQQDDVTVLTLTRLQVGEEAMTRMTAPALVPA